MFPNVNLPFLRLVISSIDGLVMTLLIRGGFVRFLDCCFYIPTIIDGNELLLLRTCVELFLGVSSEALRFSFGFCGAAAIRC